MSGIENNSDLRLKLINQKGTEINLSSFNSNIKKNDINKSIFEKFDANKDGKLDETECNNLKSYLLNCAGEDKILSKKEVKNAEIFGTKKQDTKNVFAALNDMNAQSLKNEKTEEPVNKEENENNSLSVNNETKKEEIELVSENQEETQKTEPKNDKVNENKVYNVKVGDKDTWYGIVQAKYGVTDPKKTMEIVHQLKTQNNVSKNATSMPKEINLPETLKMEDGTEVKMQDVNAKADTSHYKEKEVKTERTGTEPVKTKTQKSSQAAARKAAAAARDKALRKDLGLINYKGAGDEVKGDWYKNGKKTRSQTLTKIGNATHGRTICKDKSGKVYVVAHNGVILKNTWVNVSAHRDTQVIGKRRVAVEKGTRDEHGRKIVYDGDGKQHVMSHDKKILKNDYVARSDKSDLIRKDSKTAQQASVEMLEAQLNSAKAAFNEQMKQDGWAADAADGISKLWNNDLFGGGTGNTASQVREEFKTYQKNLNELKLAAKQGDGAFKAKFKQIYGVEYNQKAVTDYNMNPTEANYEKAFGKKNNIAQRVAKYNASQQQGATIIKTGAEVAMTTATTIAADALEIVTLGASTPVSMAVIGATTFVSDVLVEGSDRYKFTGEYKDADGNIVKDDGNFRDGTDWNGILKDAGTDAAIAATTFGVGKAVTAAYKVGKATVAAGKIAKTTEKATTGIAKTTVSKAEQAVIDTVSDVGVSAVADYAENGKVSLESVAMNAAVGGTGFAAERLAGKLKGMKKGAKASKTEISNVTQETHTTGRNEIADAEVARNIDQSHLNGRDRNMVAREMDAQATPTPAELDAYAKEHAYQKPTAEERAALDAHQAEVRADYADAHKIENNATIKQQKEPKTTTSADNATIKNLENEINSFDGQLRQLNRQLAGAEQAQKMGRKNEATIKKLEEQIEKLSQQRSAKAVELDTAKKAQNTANTTAETPKTENTAPKEETKPEIVIGRGASPEAKATQKAEVKAEQNINTISTEDKLAMGQIGNDVNKAKTSTDLDKLNAQLDKIPDCPQKRNLQKQIQEKSSQINTAQSTASSTNTANKQNNQFKNLSDEVSNTFGNNTQKKLSENLREGQSVSVDKGDTHYVIKNNNGKIEIISKTPKVEVNFNVPLSNRTPNGAKNVGVSMKDALLPEQKAVYNNSYQAFMDTKNKKIAHTHTNTIDKNNILHGTNFDSLMREGGILDNGLIPREISGKKSAAFSNGTVPDTLTPLCTDVWDVRQPQSIKNYFDARSSHWQNVGESNFLPSTFQSRSPFVVVMDTNSIDSTIMKNSFEVNQRGKSQSVLFQNGNMSTGHDYPTHRAIPIGAPANSIEKIVVDTRIVDNNQLAKIKEKIANKGYDIKLYDMSGNEL